MKNLKLRYYLRGLGIGIFVTVLIVCIGGKTDNTMTDAQVREKALELGMIDADSVVLSRLQGNTVAQPGTMNPENGTQESTEEASADTVQKSEAPEETAEVPDDGTEEASPVKLEIRSGASSYSVSKDLEKAGLIENAGDFDDYLCQKGYSKSIRVGTFEIEVGTDEEEIAKIITGKR